MRQERVEVSDNAIEVVRDIRRVTGRRFSDRAIIVKIGWLHDKPMSLPGYARLFGASRSMSASGYERTSSADLLNVRC